MYKRQEKNSQFIFIYRTDIDLSRRVNVDVRNKTIEEVLKQMFAGTDLEYHIRDRQVIIRKAISREETRPTVSYTHLDVYKRQV